MFGKRKKSTTAYGIVGLGRFGEALARELAKSGAELLVIDRDEERVREMRELTENALVVNTLDKKTLAETGIQNCDIAIVCIGEHMESSILTTLNLVSLGIPSVISKATSPEHGEILTRLGAEVVYPERDMAERLANRLVNNSVLDFIQLSEKINISKLLTPDALIGRTVQEVGSALPFQFKHHRYPKWCRCFRACRPHLSFSDRRYSHCFRQQGRHSAFFRMG